MKSAGIIGLGFWAPETVRRNDAWPDSFVQAFRTQREARRPRDLSNMEESTTERPYDELFVRHALPHYDDPFKGATVRRVAPPELLIEEADTFSARAALEHAQVDPKDVDVIVSSAVLQDHLCPPNASAIQDRLGCVNAAALGLEGYCCSTVAQLDMAAALIQTGRARHVLCVQSHVLNNRINDLELPSSPIFGDATTAFVVGETPPNRGIFEVVRGGDGSLRGAVRLSHPQTPGAVWYRDAAGPVIPGIDDPSAIKRLGRNLLSFPIDTIRKLCDKAKVPLDAVAAVCSIQPQPWFQAALADGLGISSERVPSTFDRFGHIGGTGVIANLIEADTRGLLRDGALVVLYGYGAGLTIYAALIRWSPLPKVSHNSLTS